ncbi:MAG: FkbM family methyltransferase [Deltaproteobacteria bacterium]|nr:FkbM family methyltransferase [Deltaproteobacteria bacterium]
MIERIKLLIKHFSWFASRESALHQVGVRGEMEELRRVIRQTMPDNPILAGFKAYSQSDEDGIIQNILQRIPEEEKTRTFMEIGCGNGLENNTHFLALNGFRGVWVDGSKENILHIKKNLPLWKHLKSPPIHIVQRFVDRNNIQALAEEATGFLDTKEIDFFSLDIDGNDLEILRAALPSISPKVICVEYNGKFPPPMRKSITYNPAHGWEKDDYYGASLQSFSDLLKSYRLVCCNLSGVNAFFVHEKYQGLFSDYSIQDLFQPPRHDYISLRNGHSPSLKWLNQIGHP